MASKHNTRDTLTSYPHSYWSRRGSTGYMVPSVTEPYVYLKQLFFDGIQLSTRIGHLAESQLHALGTNLTLHGIGGNISINGHSKNISPSKTNALAFLKSVAESQRAHELQFINTRIQELKSLGKIGTEEQKIIDSLDQIKNNPAAFDYKSFITGFNMVITNLNKYRTRLEGFKKTKTSISTPQVNLVQQLEATLNDFSYYRANFQLKQEEMIRQLTLLFLQEDAGAEFIKNQIGKNGVENLAAATAMIQQQLAQFLYDKGYLKYNKQEYSLDDFKKEIERLQSKFKEFETTTNINDIYTNQELLDTIKQLYGIEISKDMRMYKRTASQKASTALNNVKQAIGADPIANKNKYFQNLLRHVRVTWKANSKFDNNLAFHQEIVSGLADAFNSHAHLGNKINLATDMLLGHIVIDNEMPTDQANNVVQDTLHSIKEKLLNNSIGHDAEQLSEIYLKELNNLDQQLHNLQNAFIIHETTKNFNTLEAGAWPQKQGQDLLFGRKQLNIFNYIDSINSLGVQLGINSQWLKFAAYNLADNTLGSFNRAPLETFFAIFAGMLMFDDFAIIGQEISKQVKFNNITNIHLYKLQDTYFPASVFLDATYQALISAEEAAENNIMSGNAFNVSISAPSVPYTGQEATSFPERWPIVRQFAESHNKIDISFAAGFLTLMRELLDYKP